MNYLDSYSFYFDRSITAAWEAQRKYVTKSPRLNEALQYGDELFARFAACYADLRALPRGARRSLQRHNENANHEVRSFSRNAWRATNISRAFWFSILI